MDEAFQQLTAQNKLIHRWRHFCSVESLAEELGCPPLLINQGGSKTSTTVRDTNKTRTRHKQKFMVDSSVCDVRFRPICHPTVTLWEKTDDVQSADVIPDQRRSFTGEINFSSFFAIEYVYRKLGLLPKNAVNTVLNFYSLNRRLRLRLW